MTKIELFTIAGLLNSLVTAYEKEGEKGYTQRLAQVKGILADLYKEYNTEVDKKLFESLLELYVTDQQKQNISPMVSEKLAMSAGNYRQFAEKVYSETDLHNATNTLGRLEQPAVDVVNYFKNNPAVSLMSDMQKTYQSQVQGALNEIQNRINKLQRAYMQAQMEVFKEKTFYPDANSTMRITYGNVKGYEARDAVKFDHYTWLDGVMEKYKPGDYEFDVPDKLKELYKNRDYGQYASNGRMPVCFIASNHTTGGNSGSPALDAYGNLIGINFDRVWEGTMSDINYDPAICRNIMVDIRYILFIVDKYANATHLIKEMKLVHPKMGKKPA